MKQWMTGLAIALCAMGASAQQPMPSGGANVEAAMQALQELQKAPIVEFSESDVERFIALAKAADESDIKVEGLEDGQMPNFSKMADALRANDDAMKLLGQHGFTPESYRDISVNIALALGASELRKNESQMKASLAQVESMKGMMPEGQYNMMVEQLTGTLQAFERAPDSNVAVVEKMRPALEEL